MYVCITRGNNNKDVYIKQSYRKDNGQTSSRIHRKLGKFNDLLEQFRESLLCDYLLLEKNEKGRT